MSRYVAAYDISDDRRRERVARLLLGYGHRVQKSVYELWLEPDEVVELRRELGPQLALEDALHLFPIDDRGSRTTVSWQRDMDEFDPVVIV